MTGWTWSMCECVSRSKIGIPRNQAPLVKSSEVGFCDFASLLE